MPSFFFCPSKPRSLTVSPICFLIKKLIYKAIKKKADFIATPEVSSIFSFDKAYLKKELNDLLIVDPIK